MVLQLYLNEQEEPIIQTLGRREGNLQRLALDLKTSFAELQPFEVMTFFCARITSAEPVSDIWFPLAKLHRRQYPVIGA